MSELNPNKSASNFSTRLRVLMSTYGYPSVAALAKDLGHERSENLSRIHRDPKAKPSVDIIGDLADKFVDLNLDWLLTGRGEPRLNHPRHGIPSSDIGGVRESGIPRGIPSSENEAGSVRFDLSGQPAVVTVAEGGEPNIVMLNAQAAAGLPANYANPEWFVGKPAFRLPGYRYNSGTLVAVQVIGDSMHPTIGHEDWLIARHLVNPLQELREGYVHLLVARDGVVAKRLFKAPGGFLCRSDNELYPPYELPYGEALQVYVVLAILSEDLSNKGADIRERLGRLEKDVLALQGRLKPR
jgi:hypothetical protein